MPLKTEDKRLGTPHTEGELYRVVYPFGRRFELRYGYYEEKDRQNPLCAPAVIYPDFVQAPVYTEDGRPFVTVIQDACERFAGAARTADSICAECRYFLRGEEWFGLCGCPENREEKKKERSDGHGRAER